MSFSVIKKVGELEKMNISASIMHGLWRADQMIKLVMGSEFEIVQTQIEAGIIEERNYNDSTPYQGCDQLLWRQIRFEILVANRKPDAQNTEKVIVVLEMTSGTLDNKTSERRKWAVSDDFNFIKVGDRKECIEFKEWSSAIQDYIPKLSQDSFCMRMAKRHGFELSLR